MPAGWNFDAPYATTASLSGSILPTSSPNVLAPVSATNSYFLCTWGTVDGNNGDVVVQTNVNWFAAGSHKARGACTARGSAPTLNFTNTSFYTGHLDLGQGVSAITKVVNGTQTSLGSVAVTGLATSVWYQITFTCLGTLLTLSVQRLTDSKWLNSGGTFQASFTLAVSLTDATLSGSGYSGILEGNDIAGQSIYFDDWSLSQAVAPLLTPYMKRTQSFIRGPLFTKVYG